MATEGRGITNASVLAEVGARMEKDAAFVEQLRQNPEKTLVAMGIRVPPGILLRLEPDSPTTSRLAVYHVEGAELTDEALSKVAGGLARPPLSKLLLSSASLRLRAGNLAWDEVAYGTGGGPPIA